MKPSSGTRASLRVIALVVATVAALGYYGHVRAQSGVGSVIVPLRPLAPLSSVPIPAVFGLEGIVADKAAAVQLGKALFWDMQAGSDDIQACASCHFNAGADSRGTNDVNPGQPGGDNTFQIGVPFNGKSGTNYHYNPGSSSAGFGGSVERADRLPVGARDERAREDAAGPGLEPEARVEVGHHVVEPRAEVRIEAGRGRPEAQHHRHASVGRVQRQRGACRVAMSRAFPVG